MSRVLGEGVLGGCVPKEGLDLLLLQWELFTVISLTAGRKEAKNHCAIGEFSLFKVPI